MVLCVIAIAIALQLASLPGMLRYKMAHWLQFSDACWEAVRADAVAWPIKWATGRRMPCLRRHDRLSRSHCGDQWQPAEQQGRSPRESHDGRKTYGRARRSEPSTDRLVPTCKGPAEVAQINDLVHIDLSIAWLLWQTGRRHG